MTEEHLPKLTLVICSQPFFSGSNSTTALFTDANSDGWLDIQIAYPGYGPEDFFFLNDGIACKSWIEIDLTGTLSNRDGMGARIAAKANIGGVDKWQHRMVSSLSAKAGHNMQRTHFGFDDASIIDTLIIYWPSGTVCTFTNVDVNQIIDINEACTIATIISPPPGSGVNSTISSCTISSDTTIFGGGVGGVLSFKLWRMS